MNLSEIRVELYSLGFTYEYSKLAGIHLFTRDTPDILIRFSANLMNMDIRINRITLFPDDYINLFEIIIDELRRV